MSEKIFFVIVSSKFINRSWSNSEGLVYSMAILNNFLKY